MQFFKTKKAGLIISITGIGFGGLFAWFSYIAPLMTHVSGFSENSISYIMVIGNLAGGYMADNMRPAKAAAILFLVMVLALIVVFFFSQSQPISLVMAFVCGALSMAVGTPVNVLMLRSAKESAMMAAAIMQAAFNIANSMGAFLGGLPLKWGYGYQYPSLVGAVLALAGLGLSLLFMARYKPVTEPKRQKLPVLVTNRVMIAEGCEV